MDTWSRARIRDKFGNEVQGWVKSGEQRFDFWTTDKDDLAYLTWCLNLFLAKMCKNKEVYIYNAKLWPSKLKIKKSTIGVRLRYYYSQTVQTQTAIHKPQCTPACEVLNYFSLSVSWFLTSTRSSTVAVETSVFYLLVWVSLFLFIFCGRWPNHYECTEGRFSV